MQHIFNFNTYQTRSFSGSFQTQMACVCCCCCCRPAAAATAPAAAVVAAAAQPQHLLHQHPADSLLLLLLLLRLLLPRHQWSAGLKYSCCVACRVTAAVAWLLHYLGCTDPYHQQ
jgi:hypothetical protein